MKNTFLSGLSRACFWGSIYIFALPFSDVPAAGGPSTLQTLRSDQITRGDPIILPPNVIDEQALKNLIKPGRNERFRFKPDLLGLA